RGDGRDVLQVRRRDEPGAGVELGEPEPGRQRSQGRGDRSPLQGPCASQTEGDVSIARTMGAHARRNGEKRKKVGEKEEEVSVLRPLRRRSSPDPCTPLCR